MAHDEQRLWSVLTDSIGNSVFECIVNVWLVAKGARPGMMVARYDLTCGKADEQIRCILDFAKSLNLRWEQTQKYEYVIGTEETMSKFVKDNKGIGKALGFQCYNHEFYHDHQRNRYSKSIWIEFGEEKVQIVEVADAKLISEQELIAHMNQKIDAIRRVVPEDFIVHGEVRFIPSVWTRFRKLDDLIYVVEHLDEYINDFDNFCEIIDRDEFERIVGKPNEYIRYLPLLKMVYEKYICIED